VWGTGELEAQAAEIKTMKTAYEVLQLLTTKIQPPSGQHHGFTLPPPGVAGLLLTVQADGSWYSALLDEQDFQKDAALIVEEVLGLLEAERARKAAKKDPTPP
jgi:hypothetical protein